MVFPSLLTVYEIEAPLQPVCEATRHVKESLQNEKTTEFDREAYLLMILARLEAAMTQILEKLFRLDLDRVTDVHNLEITVEDLKSNYSADHALTMAIERKLISISMGNSIEKYMKTFWWATTLPAFDEPEWIERLREYKATRNLIAHNDLRINGKYISDAGKLARRPTHLQNRLEVPAIYVRGCCDLIDRLVEHIVGGIRDRFGDRTRLCILRQLWGALFNVDVHPFESFWRVDVGQDRIASRIPSKRNGRRGGMSSTEEHYFQIWNSHFSGETPKFERFDMKLFDDEHADKLLAFMAALRQINLEASWGA